MNLTLKSFSQDMVLARSEYQNYLVFDARGKELRIPVPQETITTLMEFLVANKEPKQALQEAITEPDEEDFRNIDSSGAEEFGGDSRESIPERMVFETVMTVDNAWVPSSEEEVPSL